MNAKKPQLNPVLKLVLDLGPLVLFFVANSRPALFLPLVAPILPADIAAGERAGIFVATAVFMVAIVVALAVSYALTRHLPIMPIVTAVIVLVFGALTLVLHDEHLHQAQADHHLPAVRRRAARRARVRQAAPRAWCSIRCFTSPRRAGAS